MAEKKQDHTHTMMPKKLAEALMEAGVQHFSAGGTPSSIGGAGSQWADQLGAGGFFGDAMKGADQAMGFNDYNAQAPEVWGPMGAPAAMERSQNVLDTNYIAQGDLANMLLQQAQGGGANPSMKQFQNQTGQNTNQQAALMAGQRGASSNPQLLARQIAMQGAANQQQSVGQQQALQAQQQMAAHNQLAGVYNNQANQALQSQNINQGAIASYNTARTQGSLGAQNINANVSGQNAQRAGNMQDNFMSMMGGVMGMYKGGTVPKYADGGLISYNSPYVSVPGLTGYKDMNNKPMEQKPKKKKEETKKGSPSDSGMYSSGQNKTTGGDPFGDYALGESSVGISPYGGGYAEGGEIDASPDITVPDVDATLVPQFDTAEPDMGTPDETQDTISINPNITFSAPSVMSPALTPYTSFMSDKAKKKQSGGGGGGMLGGLGGMFGGAQGGPVPGEPEVKKNSVKNDVVPALLSPGEIVLPLSVTQSGDVEKKAIEFLRHLKSNKKGYEGVANAKKMYKGGRC